MNYLPTNNLIKPGIRKGRNPYQGYQRGWGLEFGDLKQKILADPLYIEGFKLSRNASIVAHTKQMNIFLIIKYFLSKIPFGHIIEYGSYACGNAIFMATIAREIDANIKVYALDSFEGMPASDWDIDYHTAGDFGDVDLNEIKSYVKKIGLTNIEFVKGYFEDTEYILKQIKNISLAHIDCDIYSSVKFSYESVMPYVVNEGYIIFDDPLASSCLGANEVVEEIVIRQDGLNSEQVYPHHVFRKM